MTDQPSESTAHKGDLFLQYLEGRLTSEQREELEAHLRGCATCSVELEELREIVTALTEHREAFCPELSQLYELVHYGIDTEGLVAKHLAQCPSCREACKLLQKGSGDDLSEEAARTLAARASSQALESPVAGPYRHSVILRSIRRFTVPAMAASLAAAVLITAFLLYPWRMPEYAVMVSSVSWEQVPRPKEVGGTRPRSATVIVLKGFQEPLEQVRVNNLYQAAAPTMELYERYRMVSPEAVKKKWDSEPPSSANRQSLIRWLNKKLDVSRAAIITLSPDRSGINVKADLVDTASGKVLNSSRVRDIPATRLTETVRHLVLGLFLPADHPS